MALWRSYGAGIGAWYQVKGGFVYFVAARAWWFVQKQGVFFILSSLHVIFAFFRCGRCR